MTVTSKLVGVFTTPPLSPSDIARLREIWATAWSTNPPIVILEPGVRFEAIVDDDDDRWITEYLDYGEWVRKAA